MMSNSCPRIFFVSLGCDKNRVDSEKMMSYLSDFGLTFTDNEHEAEVIIINSCCFIEAAKKETIDTVLEMSELKKEGICKVLIMAGCMSNRYADELMHMFPSLDGFVKTDELPKIADVVSKCLIKSGIYSSHKLNKLKHFSGSKILTTPGHYAYLKISDGCDRHCTYCIIPYIRGPYVSFPKEDILNQAKDLAEFGVKELILVAQETTYYGTDLYKRKVLSELLKDLCKIEGIQWIRILYAYPEEITDDLINIIADEPKICNYLDMPIQHISDNILKKMGRKTSGHEIEDIIFKIREKIPDIALRTTLLTGFPGESKRDHEELLSFINRIGFDKLGVFTYSKEEGTPASLMSGQIDEKIKEIRRCELMESQKKISEKLLNKRLGQIYDIIVDGKIPDEDVYVGRTFMDAPDVDGCFFFKSDKEFITGDFVKAVAMESTDYDLIGEII